MTNFSPFPEAARRLRGFTLAELAIVLVIVALLLGGLMTSLSAQRDIQNLRDTQRYLAEVKEALLGFAAAHCRLPCPADPTLASGSTDAGVESPLDANAKPTCSTQIHGAQGVLPWATLGVAETDAWGRRLTYRVTAKFATAAACPPAAFKLGDDGDIHIKNSAANAADIYAKLPAIVVSHGKNGLRAYLPDGSRLPASADADEEKNAGNDATFVAKTPTETFDDLLDWISPSILKNRMISAGRLP